jgi:hypothetical protein
MSKTKSKRLSKTKHRQLLAGDISFLKGRVSLGFDHEGQVIIYTNIYRWEDEYFYEEAECANDITPGEK